MNSSLEVLVGKNAGKHVPISGARMLIGRDPGCHLRANSEMISRYHCEIFTRDGSLLLRDFGSKNGSYINERRIDGEAVLASGDRLAIGPLVFRVHVQEPAPVYPARPAKQDSASVAGDPRRGSRSPRPSTSEETLEVDICQWLASDTQAEDSPPRPGDTAAYRPDSASQSPNRSPRHANDSPKAAPPSAARNGDHHAAEALKQLRGQRWPSQSK